MTGKVQEIRRADNGRSATSQSGTPVEGSHRASEVTQAVEGTLGMRQTTASILLLILLLACAAWGTAQEAPAASSIPPAWLAAWDDPPAADRPLQIIHTIDPTGRIPDGIQQVLHGTEPSQVARLGMQFYKSRGLGGIVCNVAFNDYMRSEENWQTLIAGVRACQELGMVVWLYDEEGYPSGAAGGSVLKQDPAFEALALVMDRSQPDPFFVRRAYEHTHASNNYYAARRYINLIDDRAARSFISHTHDNYYRRLKPYFGRTIQAMFTDEPSLIAVNLGQIPEEARKAVRVADPIDPAVQPLPSVPWVYDITKQYKKRYGADLIALRRSLFEGDSRSDREVRSRFWSLIGDLVAARYFGALQNWCGRHRVASSGHGLWEESLIHHPALQGNAIKALTRMDIPGLDVLTSNPEAVIDRHWLTAAIPASAATLTGRRRVMTEVSDFSQKMGGKGPCSLAQMQATAAWQAAWGVTDFTLYYDITDRPPEEYRAYCAYVGRLNTILKPADPDPEVLLYYPVNDLWAEYLPAAEPLQLESQSPRAQRIVRSFNRLGQMLPRNQIPFALVDHEHLAGIKVSDDGRLDIKGHRFASLILPSDVQLPSAAGEVVGRFKRKGGRVITDGAAGEPLSAAALAEAARPAFSVSPASEKIVLGSFVRERRRILLLVNVDSQAYQGELTTGRARHWRVLDPASGAIHPAMMSGSSQVQVALEPNQAVLLAED